MAWTWGSLADEVLGPLLEGPMKRLENYLGLSEKVFPSQAKAITTDATVTTLATILLPVDTTTLIQGYVVGRRTGGAAGATNDGAGYEVKVAAKNTAGTAAVIGAATVTALGESQAAWDVTVVASGPNLLIKVAAAVNNTVLWRWTARSFSASS